MVASLQAIQQLEQERKRAVDELHRLQRVVARHDEQDKEAAKAAELRRLDVAAQIERLEKEKKELAEKVSLQKNLEAFGGFGLSVLTLGIFPVFVFGVAMPCHARNGTPHMSLHSGLER